MYMNLDPDISHGLKMNLDTVTPLSVAIAMEELIQGREPESMADLEHMAEAFDHHVDDLLDRPFFASLFREFDVQIVGLDDMRDALQDKIRDLRAISVFKKGDFVGMKRFCLTLNDRLLAASMPQRRYLA